MEQNYERIIKNIQSELTNYIQDNNLKALVIGVSGGIDSALCCALAQPVCKSLNIPLIGRSLPISGNKSDEIERANKVGNVFCDDFKEIDLMDTFVQVHDKLCVNEDEDIALFNKDVETKIRFGNVKARLRMIYLYNLAQKYHGMVLSTDNSTEWYMAFWTLHGDVGDYGMIQNLWKTEVYNLSKYMAIQYSYGKSYDVRAEALDLCVKGVATDGLGITTSDVEQLGAKNYSEVDIIIKTWLTDDEDKFNWDDRLKFINRPDTYEEFVNFRNTYKNHPVVIRYERTHFKRNNPYNIMRTNLFLK